LHAYEYIGFSLHGQRYILIYIYKHTLKEKFLTALALRTNPKFMRSADGVFLGVFAGAAREFQVSANFLRALWLLSFFGFGIGLFFYLVLGFTLPREDKLAEYEKPKALGACVKIAKKTNVDLGVVRTIAVFLFFASFGSSLIAYVLVALLLDSKS
jgi:phage shock protein PspC (stress-responsive transcriptional regulator)